MNKVIAGTIVGASALIGMTTILNADEVKQAPNAFEMPGMVLNQHISAAKQAVEDALANVAKAKAVHSENERILSEAMQKHAIAQHGVQDAQVELNAKKQSHKEATDAATEAKQADIDAQEKLDDAHFDVKNREVELEATQQQQEKADDNLKSITEDKLYAERFATYLEADIESITDEQSYVQGDLKRVSMDLVNAQNMIPTDEQVNAADVAQQQLGDKARTVEQNLIAAGQKANEDLQKANVARHAVEVAENKLNDLLKASESNDEDNAAKTGFDASLPEIKKAQAELLAARQAYEAADIQAKTSVRAADELEQVAYPIFQAADEAIEKFYQLREKQERGNAQIEELKSFQVEVQRRLEAVTSQLTDIKSRRAEVAHEITELTTLLKDAEERVIFLSNRVDALSDEKAIEKALEDAKKIADEAMMKRMQAEDDLTDMTESVEKAQANIVRAQKALQAAKAALMDAQDKFNASKLALEKANEALANEQKKLTDELKSGSEADKPKTDDKKVDDKPKTDDKKVDDKPNSEDKKVDDKPKTDDKKVDDKPKTDEKKVDDKSKTNDTKVDDKPKVEDKNVDEKSKSKQVDESASQKHSSKNDVENELPNTGSEEANNMSILGVLFAGLTVWGFASKKRQ